MRLRVSAVKKGNMKIFETHAHLNFKDFNKDRVELIKRCFQSGIEYIINIGLDKETSEASIKLSEEYEQIYATVGYHPHDAEKFDKAVVLKLAKHPKVVAVGETGLDFYRNLSPQEIQKKVFSEQIQIAMDMNLPLVIHDRDAHEECLQILEKFNPPKVVFHCFSGDEIFAEKIIAHDWFISFTGSITYKKSILENVIRMVPEDRFFIETDSPFLSPVPNRGKRNSPLNLHYITEKIAEIRRISPRQVADITFRNAQKFFLKS